MDEGKGPLRKPVGSAVSERKRESWKTTLHSFGLKETKATREQRLKKEKEDDEKGVNVT
jgi:hypothetical protein